MFGNSHAHIATRRAGMPTPAPTAMAMMSLVLRPEVEVEVVVPEPEPLPMVLPVVLPEPLTPVLVGAGLGVTDPDDDGLDPPVATGTPDTIAVVVAVGCGFWSAAWHANMTERTSYRPVPAASCSQLGETTSVLNEVVCWTHAGSE